MSKEKYSTSDRHSGHQQFRCLINDLLILVKYISFVGLKPFYAILKVCVVTTIIACKIHFKLFIVRLVVTVMGILNLYRSVTLGLVAACWC